MTTTTRTRKKRTPPTPVVPEGPLYGVQVNTRLPEAQLAALKAIQARVGIPVSEQVRRAVAVWLASQEAR